MTSLWCVVFCLVFSIRVTITFYCCCCCYYPSGSFGRFSISRHSIFFFLLSPITVSFSYLPLIRKTFTTIFLSLSLEFITVVILAIFLLLSLFRICYNWVKKLYSIIFLLVIRKSNGEI